MIIEGITRGYILEYEVGTGSECRRIFAMNHMILKDRRFSKPVLVNGLKHQ